MATLANQGVASQASFGQLGSAFIDGAVSYTAPAGKVVVAMTFLEDTKFTVLTPEATGDCFGLATGSGQGTGNEVVVSTTVFPKGLTVYGRWTNFTPDAAASNGGVIVYLGPAKSPVSTP